jgi:hypothetical protein
VKTNKRLRTRVAVAGVVALLGAGAAVGTQYLASANASETRAVFRPIAGRVPAAPKPVPAEAGWKEMWHPVKMHGPGTAPIMVTSLRRVNGTPMIEQNLFGQDVFARTPLAPLQNKWITATVEITIGDKTSGAAAWSVQADGRTIAHASQNHVDTFLADRVRPKRGIYRSFNDKAHLQDCYLLLTNMRAFKKV